MNALRVLKTLKEEGRDATPEEREAIAKYVGWGRSEFANGLFGYGYYGSDGARWDAEREELRNLLTPEEFESARRSSLTAFWTHPRVAAKMWDILARMGFKGGRVHEPAVGSGVFFGTMPTDIRDKSVLSGGDKDELATLISSNLYPGAAITRGDFQEERLPDDFYDVVISNFPFADITVRRDKYNTVNANLHDYFFLKSLGVVRPGGIVAAITSTGTMDKANQAARMAIAAKADVVACFRLPSGAFKKVAGTDVATDMVILRKREEGQPMSADTAAWVETVPIKDARNLPGFDNLGFYDRNNPISKYYTLHPDHILGELAIGGQYERITVNPGKGDTMKLLERAAGTIPAGTYKTRTEAERERGPRKTTVFEMNVDPTTLRDGSIVAGKGGLYVKNGVSLEEVKVPRQQVRKAGMLIGLRDALNALRAAELSDKSEAEIGRLRKELNRTYDAFVKEYGPLSKPGMLGVMAQDPSAHMLLSLEREYDRKANKAKKSDIFSMRVGHPRTGTVQAENYEQAAGYASSETGHLDAARVAEMMHVDQPTAERELLAQGLAFRETDGVLVGADEYLSGNVRQKLARAEAAALTDPAFQANVEALRKVLPKDKGADEITANLGAPWIPTDVMEDFVAHVLGLETAAQEDRITCSYNSVAGRWTLTLPRGYGRSALLRNSKFTTDFATQHRDFTEIMGAALADEQISVTYRDEDGRTHVIEGETAAANQKAEALKEAFAEWVFKDAARREKLVRVYNDRFNSNVARKASGRWLRFDGLTPSITPRSHQAAAVEKMLACHRLLLAHEVGTGKTITYGLMALKAKETGMAHKPLLVVKNNTLAQVAAEIQRAFPNMNILVGGESMGAARRKATMAQIANNNWDLVIISHDNLDALDVDPHAEHEWIASQIRELTAAAYSIPEDSQDGKRARRGLLKRIESLQERAKNLVGAKRTDGVATFQELGFDMLMVDECQAFKKLPIATYRSRVKGIPTGGSQRAAKLQMNIDYMIAQNPDACVVFGSGTPIDNSMVELYVWQRFLQNDVLRESDIESFDAWASAFGRTTTDLEMSASGGEWHEVARFKEFVNLSELYGMMSRNMDVVFADQTGEITRPKRNDRVEQVPVTDQEQAIQAALSARAERVKGHRAEPGADNMLVICGDGRKAAVHPGLYAAEYVDAKGTKAHQVVANVAANHRKDPKAAQMIFCDCGVNKTEWGFSLYDFLVDELVKAGFKREQIAVFSAKTSPKVRKEMAEKMNNGQILVAIGSTDTMGTGINAQRRLRWLHHLDSSRTMTPGSIEQRNGRGHRQGNEYKEVEVVTYLKPGSLDSFTWTLIKNKSGFIRSFLSKGGTLSTIEEESETVTPEMMQAMASGDERVLRLAKVNAALQKLELKQRGFETAKADQRAELASFEKDIAYHERRIPELERAAAIAEESAGKPFAATVGKESFDKRDERLSGALDRAVVAAADRLKALKKSVSSFAVAFDYDLSGIGDTAETVAQYRGFDIRVFWAGEGKDSKLCYGLFMDDTHLSKLSPNFDVSDGRTGMLAVFRSADAVIPGLKKKIDPMRKALESSRTSRENLREGLKKTFAGAEDITRLRLEKQTIEDSLRPKEEKKEVAESAGQEESGGGFMAQKADPELSARLDREPTVRVYRAMQLVDGKLYPPMAARVNGKWVEPTELGAWYVADEHPEIAFEEDGKWYVPLDKGNGRVLRKVAYNPYFHTSRTPLNDQFSSASERPELVIVECEVPESELTSGYHAEKAKDSVGEKDWHSGPVASWLAEKGSRRKVILSRYAKVLRVVPDAEVAGEIRRILDGTGISIPEGVVTPALRAELERLGVDVSRQARSTYTWEKIAGTKKNPRTISVPSFTRGAFGPKTPLPDMISAAKKSVRNAGGREIPGRGLVLRIPAFGDVVVVGKPGVRHGLRPYGAPFGKLDNPDNANILPVVGEILKNSVPVNEMRPRSVEKIDGSTILLGAAFDETGALVPVVSIVNHIRDTNEIPPVKVFPLKSINTKGRLHHAFDTQNRRTPLAEVNVADIVEEIKDEVPIFPLDVYSHFKQERPQNEAFDGIRFQLADRGTASRDWSGVKVPDLRRELVRRGLSPAGTPAMLRERLAADDARRTAGGAFGGSMRFQLPGDDSAPFRLEGQTPEQMAAEYAEERRIQKQTEAARKREEARRAKAEEARRREFDTLYQGRLDIGVPGETGSLFAPRQNATRQDGGRDTLFQRRGDGDTPNLYGFHGWEGARAVERRTASGKRVWDVVGHDGKVLAAGYRTEAAAREDMARGASRLDLLDAEVSKLHKKALADVTAARRELVERLAQKQLTAEERAAQFKAFARKVGIHESLADKEWALAEKILSQETTEGVEEASERAQRAVETVLSRASIRQYQRDIASVAKKGAGTVLGNGMRTGELAEVRECLEAMHREATPEEVRQKVNDLLDLEQALLEKITSGEDSNGNALTDEQLDEAARSYVEAGRRRQIVQNFEGLLANHAGTRRGALLKDLEAWRNARDTLDAFAKKSKMDLEAELHEKARKAKEIRDSGIRDMTGGKGVPGAARRQARRSDRTLRQRVADMWRGFLAMHMSGGREWGEFLTRTLDTAFRETRLGKLFHDGLSRATKREKEDNEDDQKRAVAILAGTFGLDPDKNLKQLVDYSEICGDLYRHDGLDKIKELAPGEITLREALYDKNAKHGATRREVLDYAESECKLTLGELMSLYLYKRQAEAMAGQDFTDTPEHRKGVDVSLMESLAMHGYSARTMREIDRALQSRGLDRLAEAISADMERKADALDGVMQRHFHSHLVRIPHYAPLKRVHRGADEKFEAKSGMGGFMGLARSFMKERVTNYRDIDIERANLIDLWQEHNRQANHIVTHADWIAEVGRVMRHTKMQEALEWTVGNTARKYLNSWLDLQANGGQYRKLDAPVMDTLARRFASAVTVNPRVALKQLTSVGMALSMLPEGARTRDWLMDMAYICVPQHAAEFNRFLREKSAEWRQRGSNASDAMMLANRHVAGSKLSLFNMKLNRALSVMTRFGDKGGAMMGGYGVYMAWKRKLEAEGMRGEELEEAALERFVDAMNSGQQSGLPEYLSYAQTTGRGFKFLYMFKTAQAAMTRNFFLHLDSLLKHRGPPKQHLRGMLGIWFSDYLFKLMGGAFMSVFAMMGLTAGDDDDEETRRKKKDRGAWKTAKAALQSAADAPLSGLFIAGDVASWLLDKELSKIGHAAGVDDAPRYGDSLERRFFPSFSAFDDARLGFDKLTKGDLRQAADYAIKTCSEFAGMPYFSVAWNVATDAWPDAFNASDLSPVEKVGRFLTFSRSAIGAPKKKPEKPAS